MTFLAPRSYLRDLRTFINKIRHTIIFQKYKDTTNKLGRKCATTFLAPKSYLRNLRTLMNKIRYKIRDHFLKKKRTNK